jgi:hypothetical protein
VHFDIVLADLEGKFSVLTALLLQAPGVVTIEVQEMIAIARLVLFLEVPTEVDAFTCPLFSLNSIKAIVVHVDLFRFQKV